jgi:ornithine carbamoyltransferase
MLEEFSRYSGVPIINGLSDSYHPVQLIADYMTMVECGRHENPIVAYIGDGNNMTHSWLMLASKLGFELRVATPKGYECDPLIVEDALKFATVSGAKISFTHDPKIAVAGATVVTTDMDFNGTEEEKAKRLQIYRV